MAWLKMVLAALVALPTLVWLAAQFGALSGTAPADLGLRDGRFKPPSKTANSVSSQALLWPEHPMRSAAQIAPLALVGGDGPATLAKIKQWVQARPGALVVKSEPDYLYAQFTTRQLKFTDDAEFWFDPANGVVQVRSASRLGRRDFDVNRQRIEALRASLLGR